MAITKVTKQIREEFYLSGSILKWQADDSTEVVVLATSTVVAEDVNGLDVSATFVEQGTKRLDDDTDGDFSNNMLSARVRAGTEALSPYYVTYIMVTDEGNTFESDFRVTIKEVP